MLKIYEQRQFNISALVYGPSSDVFSRLLHILLISQYHYESKY